MAFRARSASVIGLACGALLLAATGGAVAGKLVTGADIKDGTVTGADIRNGSLQGADLSAATKASLRGKRGPRGASGPGGTGFATGVVHAADAVSPPTPTKLAAVSGLTLSYTCFHDTNAMQTSVELYYSAPAASVFDALLTYRVNAGPWTTNPQSGSTSGAGVAANLGGDTESAHNVIQQYLQPTIELRPSAHATTSRGWQVDAYLTMDTDAGTCEVRGTVVPAQS